MKPVLSAALASAFLAAGAHAQKKNQPAAGNDSLFSSNSNLVLVDTIVTDKKGAYIGDLTQENFKVREDGQEQTLTSFSHVTDGTPDGQKRYLVLLFDNVTVPQTGQHYARDAATEFIGSNAGPNRLMAIVEFGGTLRVSQNLTEDVDKLKQAVKEAKFAATSMASAPAGVPVIRNIRSRNDPASALLAAVGNLAKALAQVPGRKTVVLFSEGASVSADQMKGAIDECNRANIAIYPVALAGNGDAPRTTIIYSDPQHAAAARQAPAEVVQADANLLPGLARGTGGFVVSRSDRLPDDLNRIGKEASQYYALGYVPAKEPKPGSCHTIKVEVDRPGATVRARTGYCDAKTPDIVVGTARQRDLEAHLNAHAAPNVQATIQTPFFYVAANTARVYLALDIPGAGVKFTKDKSEFAAALNIVGVAYLPDGGVAARFSDTAKIDLDDQKQVNEFASHPYHYEKQFKMASGTFRLKVAFSSNGTSFGEVETALTIDPWTPSKFLLSGLALSQSARPAAAAVLGDEVDLFGNRVPLTFKGVQIIPTGSNRLRKSEKAYIYAQIYEPAISVPDGKEDSGVDVQLKILDAKTGELVKDAGAIKVKRETAAGAAVVPLGIVLPTGALGPGSYTAQVTAQDAAGNRATRSITFEVEP